MPKDLKKVAYWCWCAKAAEQGNANAQCDLGEFAMGMELVSQEILKRHGIG